jgi:hypothetical protein
MEIMGERTADDIRATVAVQSWVLYQRGVFPVSAPALANAVAFDEDVQAIVEAMADGDGPLDWTGDRLELAGETHQERTERVRAYALAHGFTAGALPDELRADES